MKAIVTVIGRDQVGITAAVCSILAENNINILDITQTILQDIFTMVMVVEIDSLTVPFGDFVDALHSLGKETNLEIHTMHEDIFNAMHKI